MADHTQTIKITTINHFTSLAVRLIEQKDRSSKMIADSIPEFIDKLQGLCNDPLYIKKPLAMVDGAYSAQIIAVEIHNLIPGNHKVSHKLFSAIITTINVGYCFKF